MSPRRPTLQKHAVRWLAAFVFPLGQAIAFAPVVIGWTSEPFDVPYLWIGMVLPMLTLAWLRDGTRGLRVLSAKMARVLPARAWVVAMLAVPGATLAIHAFK